MNDTKWLDALQAGDSVCIATERGGRQFAKVEKIYKLHFLVGGRKFRKDGHEAGCEWSGDWLMQDTPELRQKVHDLKRRRELLAKIRSECFEEWNSIELETIAAQIESRRKRIIEKESAPA